MLLDYSKKLPRRSVNPFGTSGGKRDDYGRGPTKVYALARAAEAGDVPKLQCIPCKNIPDTDMPHVVSHTAARLSLGG